MCTAPQESGDLKRAVELYEEARVLYVVCSLRPSITHCTCALVLNDPLAAAVAGLQAPAPRPSLPAHLLGSHRYEELVGPQHPSSLVTATNIGVVLRVLGEQATGLERKDLLGSSHRCSIEFILAVDANATASWGRGAGELRA